MTFKKFKKQVLTYFNVDNDKYITKHKYSYDVRLAKLRVDDRQIGLYQIRYFKKNKTWCVDSVNLYPFVNVDGKDLYAIAEKVVMALIRDLREQITYLRKAK